MKWHKSTEKPEGQFPHVVLLMASGDLKFNAVWDGEYFCEREEEWWDVENVVGWLYQDEVEKYLLTLPLNN